MQSFEQGDVVRVPFPYTDRATRQWRPALVVSRGGLGEDRRLLWVAMITSAENRPWPDDIPLGTDPEANLPARPSILYRNADVPSRRRRIDRDMNPSGRLRPSSTTSARLRNRSSRRRRCCARRGGRRDWPTSRRRRSCIFDPDGDLGAPVAPDWAASKPFAAWPCYHTDLDTFELGGRRVGIVGRVVGRVLRRPRRRGAVRQRMRSAGQPDLGRADHSLRPAALFCGDRPRVAGSRAQSTTTPRRPSSPTPTPAW